MEAATWLADRGFGKPAAASKKSLEVTQLLMVQGANTDEIDLSWMDD